MWSSAVAGLGFGLALIVAIGAQNAYVLRQGLRREHVGLVVAICAVSDAVLIAVGVAGVGTVIASSRPLTVAMTVLGAVVLLTYGALAARRAIRGDATLVVETPADRTMPPRPALENVTGVPVAAAAHADRNLAPGSRVGTVTGVPVAGGGGAGASSGHPVSLGAVAATALALTWLNPHVYLDTVVLLGSVATGHGDARWWFAAGAALGSVLWFTGLGFGAALLRPVFARPTAWRVLDAVIAAVMVTIATGLVVDLLTS
ncbi:LysE/ArgO family amino acid transporter [Cellulomonas sp. S1-8]|uniref:LysE/ArgO family amino acid transporter n=1 Tax=Cellulomonas sp. S1-8 TaxID=2904790 RepID=UPI0022446341|nr:LysE/ArgO family amino acid transporter [Cellulomonas sp. S1-8]UZN03216.1 LysE/ArgO family amino acid transporter [Cellulomonas sp. S1-8]